MCEKSSMDWGVLLASSFDWHFESKELWFNRISYQNKQALPLILCHHLILRMLYFDYARPFTTMELSFALDLLDCPLFLAWSNVIKLGIWSPLIVLGFFLSPGYLELLKDIL